MDTQLFPLEESLSPRLQWMRKHGVNTYFCAESDDCKWWCWNGDRTWEQLYLGSNLEENFVQADSEQEALERHANLRKIALWNFIQIMPDDQSGCRAGVLLMREEPQDKP